ncbi:MAG: GNAT family N-acetyltransferase [Flavobacteriia bacterium]|nr:GNAT family N-acetyltransferase [Flavobacteriia bacterium]
MKIQFQKASLFDIDLIFELLKHASQNLASKKINQWQFWQNPSKENKLWIEEGYSKDEFYIIQNETFEVIGMFRLSFTDELYWGKQNVEARYIHSLVIKKKFSGLNIGNKVIKMIEREVISDQINLLRLDCNAANNWLCNYYEKQDFIKVGEIQMPHSLNNLYEKKLNPILL